ncbi:MAG: class I SAM-dependent methyltransferase [Candidatus Hydrogenedentes bacterium]|nr:class I SAM-dependent methyltransferase [Candidatus Hydrogenedentota bacterium]
MNEPLTRQPEPEYMDLDDEAVVYAEADFADVNAAFVERLIELTPAPGPLLALDLGTGPADIPRRAVAARPGWRIVAQDASFAMLSIARRADRAMGLVQSDAKRLPFAPASFDLVFSNSILHHITNVEPFWAEVKRVAKPGAAVFLRDLARPDSAERAHAIVETYSGREPDLLKEEFYRSLLSAYTPGEIRGQLERAGLAMLDVALVTDRHVDIWGTVP